jgi:4-hydroxybenzoate polyprenyltransferase
MSVGFIFNDIIDKEIDKINRPKLYSIDKTVSLSTAKTLIISLTLIIFLLTFYISTYVFIEWAIIGLIVYSMLLLYSLYLKQTPLIGNIVISGLASYLPVVMTYYLPEEVVSTNFKLGGLIYTYSLFSFSIMLPREISLDIEDIEGDKIAGCKTLPILIGQNKAKRVVIFFIVLSILLSVILSFKFNHLLMPFIAIDIYLVYYITLFRKANNKEEFIKARNHLRNVLMLGLISFALVSI